MTTTRPFLQAAFLDDLEHAECSTVAVGVASLPTRVKQILWTSDGGPLSQAGGDLVALLKARRAMLQASFDTDLAADELRRYQKFVKPGQPSPHIIGLRQKQAAARQATSVAKQSFVKAAAAFVRDAGIDVPPRVSLEVFINGWVDANVPKDEGA